MTIAKSGRFWRGQGFEDLAQYLKEYMASGYPATHIRPSVCACGFEMFTVEADQEQGCVRRTCPACQESRFIADSRDVWDDSQPEKLECPVCSGSLFEVAVAFSSDGDRVRWVTMGSRCGRCGTLGSFADWKVDDALPDALMGSV